MKKLILMSIVIMTVINSFAQKSDWKEMHDFHAVMSKTFHPAEENNLQPVKDSARVLLAKAKAWQASRVPEGYDAKSIQPILKKLIAECEIIRDDVKSGKPDADIKKAITQAHETFHEIMEKCRKEESEKH